MSSLCLFGTVVVFGLFQKRAIVKKIVVVSDIGLAWFSKKSLFFSLSPSEANPSKGWQRTVTMSSELACHW